MQPMPDVELAGARRSLSSVARDPRLPSDASREIEHVIRTIRRVEKSWPVLLPYLVQSNGRLAALLRELAPLAPAELAEEIDAVLAETPEGLGVDLGSANEHNEALRGLLARFVTSELPRPGTASPTRAPILEALRRDLQSRPW